MDYCLSYIQSLPSPKPTFTTSSNHHHRWINLGLTRKRSSPSSWLRFKCGFSGLNAPLQLNSSAGKLLSSVFLNNDLDCFHMGVKNQLKKLASDRDQALARMCLSLGSDEAYLHRKIAELKGLECQTSVEDIMYMLIFSKFSEMRVHLIPNLSKCISNGRLEIWPLKDWELESIHSFEVLGMIKEHVTAVVGWKAYSNVTDAWATTKIERLHLCRLYAASILYGYFLKSASSRYRLEQSLGQVHSNLSIKTSSPFPLPEIRSVESNNVAFGRMSSLHSTSVGEVPRNQMKKQGRLKSYVMGLDQETMKMCAKPKSKEAVNLIERHSVALFKDEKTGLVESGEVISTSYASLKRFVLEAIAFGSFLWEAEEHVNGVYKLEENSLE